MYHHSRVLARQVTVPEKEHKLRRRIGTRVVVRDLFGNLAVRTKQRAVRFAVPENVEREIYHLKLQLVAVSLAWTKPVRIAVSDQRSQRKQEFVLGVQARGSGNGQQAAKGSQRSSAFQLDRICTTLSHAGYILPSDFRSWTNVSARTSQMFIRAAVCLEPAPSKQTQFISLGIHPLESSSTLSQVLFREVNSLFAESAFGIVEDEIDLPEEERLRRLRDRRYKIDGHTERQLKGRGKGVDRWPMFYIRIDPRGTDLPVNALRSDEDDRQAAKFLEKTVQLIRSMMHQFLHEHHFRPRGKGHPNHIRSPKKKLSNSTLASRARPEHRYAAQPAISGSETSIYHTTRPSVASANGSFGGRGEKLPEPSPPIPFDSWSRIKSGKPRALEDLLAGLPRSKSTGELQRSSTEQIFNVGCRVTEIRACEEPLTKTQWTPDVELLLRELDKQSDTESGNYQSGLEQNVTIETERSALEQVGASFRAEPTDFEDDVLWKNPMSGKPVRINARTGLPIPDLPPYPTSEPQASTSHNFSCLPSKTRSLRRRTIHAPCLSDLPAELRAGSETWLASLINGWRNPVFHLKERPILSFVNDSSNETNTKSRSCYDPNCSHSRESRPADYDQRLSKASLASARVLGQVDQKFILVKMSTARSDTISYPTAELHDDVLVLIDQHAADERCRAEDLYCEISKNDATRVTLPKPIMFEITSQELGLFQRVQQYFESWGIEYRCPTQEDVAKEEAGSARPVSARLAHAKYLVDQRGSKRPASAVASTESATFARCESVRDSRLLVVVRALPELIAERCRLDPMLLINILRSEVWTRREATNRASAFLPTGKDISAAKDEAPTYSWLHRISDCPRGIFDLINSRACRSAVMFNDKITIMEAGRLVRNLAKCAFPFQCAHGRPSMVILGAMTTTTQSSHMPWQSGSFGHSADDGNNQTFIQAFQTWQQQNLGSID